MKKVLIIRLGAIGDVVETTGLIRALKKTDCNIDYLTGSVPAQLLQYDKDIDNLFIFEKKDYSYIWQLAKKLKQQKYDIIFNLQPSLRLKTLCFLSKAQKTVNYKKSYKYHAVENFFETGKRIFPNLTLEKNISLYIPDDIKQKMQQELSTDKLKICFNTGANSSRQGRKWCIEYWEELTELLFKKYNPEIFVVGGKEDELNAKILTTKFPKIKSFTGQTTLIETAALLDNADIVISGDTGPIHIASATNTTCLGLYGCCSPSRSKPFGENHITISSSISCSPCDKRKCSYITSNIDDTPCMREIKPINVLNLVDTILEQK